MFDARELESITNGEWLLTQRRREGRSAAAEADLRHLSRTHYLELEADTSMYPPRKVDKLEPHEVCFLYRRRAKRTQGDVAKEMGCCPYWLREMEMGRQDCTPLLEFWET